MDIIKEINEKIKIFTTTTGKNPSALYLGEDEALLLAEWAYDSGYTTGIGSPIRDWVGSNRPEFIGLNVYVVNEDRHLACS